MSEAKCSIREAAGRAGCSEPGFRMGQPNGFDAGPQLLQRVWRALGCVGHIDRCYLRLGSIRPTKAADLHEFGDPTKLLLGHDETLRRVADRGR